MNKHKDIFIIILAFVLLLTCRYVFINNEIIEKESFDVSNEHTKNIVTGTNTDEKYEDINFITFKDVHIEPKEESDNKEESSEKKESKKEEKEEDESKKEEEPKWVSIGEFKITFYCPCEICCGQWSGMNITATGEKLELNRTIAVDPSVIPYYSEVRINGFDNQFIATDCGGAINGNEIDMFVADHKIALDYGVMYQNVYVKVGD